MWLVLLTVTCIGRSNTCEYNIDEKTLFPLENKFHNIRNFLKFSSLGQDENVDWQIVLHYHTLNMRIQSTGKISKALMLLHSEIAVLPLL